MKITTLLKPENVILELKAATQKEALEKLIEPFAANQVVNDTDKFLADLIRREAEISTVMENGVAIPHARSTSVTRLGLVIGLTDEAGIQFNPDGEIESRLFFCIAIPLFAPSSHIPLLRTLAQFSKDPKRLERITKSKTKASVVKYLAAYTP